MTLPWPNLLCAAALLCAAPAFGQAGRPEPAPEPEFVLRPPQELEPTPAPPAPSPPPAPHRSDFPGLAPVAPRMGGLAPQATGGSACRGDCARRYYFCLPGDEATTCGAEWTQCRARCPPVSGDD